MFVYCAEFQDFVKVGKSLRVKERINQLESEYGEKVKRQSEFFVGSQANSAELFAHEKLKSKVIQGEKFACSFDEAVRCCESGVTRVDKLIKVGDMDGRPVLIDRETGYVNATEFINYSIGVGRKVMLYSFLKSQGVADLCRVIEKETKQKIYFCSKGAGAAMYLNPYVFIELCRSFSAKHKITIYEMASKILNEVK